MVLVLRVKILIVLVLVLVLRAQVLTFGIGIGIGIAIPELNIGACFIDTEQTVQRNTFGQSVNLLKILLNSSHSC